MLRAAILTLLLGIAAPASAAAPATAATATASEIVLAARQAQQAGGASIQQMRMVVVDRAGAEKVRSFELKVRRDGSTLLTLARFSAPADVAGTALVVIDRPGPDDERLLYLPALRRVTRVSGAARGGAFLGSDFRFEDLELDADASHSLLRQDAQVWVIERVPRGESSYSRAVLTIWKSDQLPHQIEFFDRKGALAKRLELLSTETVGGVVSARQTRMTDLQKGTHTRIEVLSREVVADAALPVALFTREGLLGAGAAPASPNLAPAGAAPWPAAPSSTSAP
jgi:hypothetical protein